MATYSKGTNGAFSGKVGRVIGSNWRSTDYLKGLSKKSSNSGRLSIYYSANVFSKPVLCSVLMRFVVFY